MLTSLQNPQIKRVVRLRQRRVREREGAFLIEGGREILRATEVALPMDVLFVSEHAGSDVSALADSVCDRCGAQVVTTTQDVFKKISYRDNPDGLLAVAPTPAWGLERFTPNPTGLYVLASAVEKPGNLGAILRCADAVGVDGVIVCDTRTDVFNPNVVRASVGTLFTVPVAVAERARVLAWIHEHDIELVATSPEAKLDYDDHDMTGAVAIVLGSEAQGLDDEWLESADARVRIPMLGHADSINVAMAATVMLFEAQRQRRAAI